MARSFSDREVPSHDEKWHEAVGMFRSGDRAGALFLFQRLAKEGCSPALVEIGNIYEQGGGGIERDVDKAIEWYSRSVKVLDDPKAHLGLGRLYLQCGKTDDDYFNAYHHFSLLESTQEMGAFYGLGVIHDLGLGVSRDTVVAVRYYQQACQLGHVLAARNLARITLKSNPFKGIVLWLISCWKIWRLALKNPSDPRLSIY
ncbi:MAG: tetratricopeptide repeat protein [Pseudomonadales bacterium]|nr:sel1 repeat family protein [Pseudomonadales bacterium]